MSHSSPALDLITTFVSANAPGQFDLLALHRMAAVIASNSDFTRLFLCATRGAKPPAPPVASGFVGAQTPGAAPVEASHAVGVPYAPLPDLPPALLKRGRYGSSGGLVPSHLLMVPSATRT